MAAVRSLQVSVKSESGSERSDSESDSESDQDTREPEPMEVEEGELESVPVCRSLKELIPDISRRYENKAGTFITGIDVTSKEAVEKKEQRAKRFHFRAEVNLAQRNVVLDREMMRKAIPRVRLEALRVSGVDEMSTQDIFGFFKEYPPAHIEWIDDSSCNVVWLDDITSTRALINISRMPDQDIIGKASHQKNTSERPKREKHREDSDEETEEGEVEDDDDDDDDNDNSIEEENEGRVSESDEETEKKPTQELETDVLSQAEKESLLRNDLRPAVKTFKGNKLFLRFATYDDKKELGAAKRSQYYMKYGNPNYGGMKGILSNSWKRRYHSRRLHRDLLKTKKSIIGDDVGLTPPYKHRHSDLLNVPEEPIEEEDEGEEEDEDMDEDERVVEYREEPRNVAPLRRTGSDSDSDEMDYDLELKMISTPSPKKTMKMTMYADEVESKLKTIRNSMRADSIPVSSVKNRIGTTGKTSKEKVTDVRILLEEKRQNLSQQPLPFTPTKTDVRQRLGKRPRSPDNRTGKVTVSTAPLPRREPLSDVHSRLGFPKQDSQRLYSDGGKDRKLAGSLWSRLGTTSSSSGQKEKFFAGRSSNKSTTVAPTAAVAAANSSGEDDDSELQRVWGAMIKEKEKSHKKRSRLDNLPSLQIEISRESSNGSDSES
ncbi:nuclear cap-binding protein subunit 3 isoform X1 [Erpetoichthys calabaricus]|uniref:Nuclear cap-binding protein subunit 3 n=1 Tax=Erpetoichthys calabaricus TaxID=27687 RepID=A0A8C4S8B6_ERPCA|nr:nuclear cap-binding protein subunit 3 isoform X1 [Erpetoichthys calabaricus]